MVTLHLLAAMFYLVAAAPKAAEIIRLENANEGDNRVFGGDDVAPGEFPHQVSLHMNGDYFCAGSLIGANEVLTAAECCYVAKELSHRYDLVVRVGNLRLNETDENEKEIKVSEIIIHEDFDINSAENDICLLILSENADVSSSSVGFIQLPEKNQEYSPGTLCTVIGWGANDTDSDYLINFDLQKVTVPVISDSECKQYHGEEVFSSMLCTGGLENRTDVACQFDIGGPMICNSGKTQYLDGIVSSVSAMSYYEYADDYYEYEGCGQSFSKPDVYTQTSYFIDWIEKHSTATTTDATTTTTVSGSSHHGSSIVMLLTSTCLMIFKQFL